MESLEDYQLFKFISEDFRELRIIRRIIDFSFLYHRVGVVPLQKAKYFLYIIARPFKVGSSPVCEFFACFAEKEKKQISSL